MKCLHLLSCIAIFCLSACQISPTALPALKPMTTPQIDRRPAPVDFQRGPLAWVPHFDPESEDPFQVDLRSYDLSGLDLSGSLDDLFYAVFDDQTIWPSKDQLPEGFDWELILELGKNPGLGVRSLHERGITGLGVGIAIIDQPLLTEHQEYASQLKLYEENKLVYRDVETSMHGPAVASIAVGETLGVAPEATLYYIASWPGDYEVRTHVFTRNFRYYAEAIMRMLEINEQLPEENKIRVITMQIGWHALDEGAVDIRLAVEQAKAAGMLVVSSNIEKTYGFKFHGLGRHPMADPDSFESYEPGLFWAESFYMGDKFSDRLLIPMDSRTTASPTGADEYVFYRGGGWSWSIPYIGGVYALVAQVDEAITPERFWSLAMETGRTIAVMHGDETIPLGPIIDPVALIEALEKD
jgi:subtilisin family serine protease